MIALALALGFAVNIAGVTPFTCAGPYVPPNDYDERGHPIRLEFAVHVAPLGTPLEAVREKAAQQLVSRLCRLAEPGSCALLAESVKPWNHKDEGDKRCAMAVVSSRDLEHWRTQLSPNIDEDIKKALQPLMPVIEELPQKKKFLSGATKKRTVMVVLGGVDDRGAPGGLRADWLLGRVRGVFTEMGVEMIEPPRGWNGARPPKDVELIVKGTLIDRIDPTKQLPVFDTTFTAIDAKGKLRTGKPFTIPAALAPQPPKPVVIPPPPPLVGLALHVESRGGSLCPGDYTQIHVRNDAPEELYVRVFNIDDNGEVLLLFPSETRADDRLLPGKSVSLSYDGFTVDGAPGAREQYIAIAARGPEGLGRFRDMRGTCRFKKEDAKKLVDGKKLEAPYRMATGFTLLDDVRCGKPMPIPDKQLQAMALGELAWCPALE